MKKITDFLKGVFNFLIIIVVAHLVVIANHYMFDWEYSAENVIGALAVYLLVEHLHDKKNWWVFGDE